MADNTQQEREWAVEQLGLDGDRANGQVTLDGGIAKDHLRDGKGRIQ